MLNQETIDAARDRATEDLHANFTGEYFAPHKAGAFPDEFFWDTCFVAIGLSNDDPDRAANLLSRLRRSQWDNGKFPNQHVDPDRPTSFIEKTVFGSSLCPESKDDTHTSGISQPPMLAHATWEVGKRLAPEKQKQFYELMLPSIIKYHSWLFDEREINGDGLVTQIHPYETGMDNTPPQEIRIMESRGIVARALGSTILNPLVNPLLDAVRRDFRHAPKNHRMHNPAVIAYQFATFKLRRHGYNMDKIVADDSIVLTEDLAYNSIFAEANQSLVKIADSVNAKLPRDLLEGIERQKSGFDNLWSKEDQRYYSRDARTKELIPIETVASLLPLYSGVISPERAEIVKNLLLDDFLTNGYIPSVPTISEFYDRYRYWSGPEWEWISLLLIDGLRNYGYNELAGEVADTLIEATAKNGVGEYRDVETGKVLGVVPFSGSAAVIIELACRQLSRVA